MFSPAEIATGVLIALGLAACVERPDEVSPLRPNLVLVIADDQSFEDFGFMGSPVAQTPQIDRLASEGTVFRSGYSISSRLRAREWLQAMQRPPQA